MRTCFSIRIPHSAFRNLSPAALQPGLAQGARFGRGLVVALDAEDCARAARGGRARAGLRLLLGRAREAQADVSEGLFVGRRLHPVDVAAEEVCEVEAGDLGGDALEVFDRVGAATQVVAVVRTLQVELLVGAA